MLFCCLLMASFMASVQSTDTSSDYRSCPLEKWSLEERQNRSQIIFTGVIESCDSATSTTDVPTESDSACQSNESDLRLSVRVKKVFKGLERQFEGRLVSVFGLKDLRLCPSRIRLRDTRIFLVNTLSDNDDHHQWQMLAAQLGGSSSAMIQLRLNSSLMAVSLRHNYEPSLMVKTT